MRSHEMSAEWEAVAARQRPCAVLGYPLVASAMPHLRVGGQGDAPRNRVHVARKVATGAELSREEALRTLVERYRAQSPASRAGATGATRREDSPMTDSTATWLGAGNGTP